jgi:hypothetical protein
MFGVLRHKYVLTMVAGLSLISAVVAGPDGSGMRDIHFVQNRVALSIRIALLICGALPSFGRLR